MPVQFNVYWKHLGQLKTVLRIRDTLVRIRIRILGSGPLTNGFGCGSGRPKKYGSGTVVPVHFYHSSKIVSHIEVKNSRNQDFSTQSRIRTCD